MNAGAGHACEPARERLGARSGRPPAASVLKPGHNIGLDLLANTEKRKPIKPKNTRKDIEDEYDLSSTHHEYNNSIDTHHARTHTPYHLSLSHTQTHTHTHTHTNTNTHDTHDTTAKPTTTTTTTTPGAELGGDVDAAHRQPDPRQHASELASP